MRAARGDQSSFKSTRRGLTSLKAISFAAYYASSSACPVSVSVSVSLSVSSPIPLNTHLHSVGLSSFHGFTSNFLIACH